MPTEKPHFSSASFDWAFYVLGFFFLASGLGKAVAVYTFVPLVKSVLGGSLFSMGVALTIPVLEVALGLCLVLWIYPRACAGVALVLLVVFTLAFAVNYFMHGVEDCGCFGALELLKTPPLISFVRNGMLIALALVCFQRAPAAQVKPWKVAVVFLFTVVSALASGVSAPKSGWASQSPWIGQPIEQTPLRDFVRVHPDSTYLVFLFSYQCYHCWDATENVKAYQRTGAVDRIIAWGIGTEAEREGYVRAFDLNFMPAVVSWEKIKPLLGGRGGVPQVYLIEKDTVSSWMQGEVPSPHTFFRSRQAAK